MSKTFLQGIGSLLLALLLPLSVHAESGKEVLAALLEGNKRFVDSQRSYPDLDQNRRSTLAVKGQAPIATVLSCSDSRVPPEHVFDQGLGNLFVVRVAGNVADTDEIGSIEYGTEHLGTPLLLVLGHSSCGAVTAVFKGDSVGGSIPLLVDNIVPAVREIQAERGTEFNAASLDLAIRSNVVQQVRSIMTGSSIVRELVEKGELMVAGAIYHLDDGRVEIIDVGAGLEAVHEASASTDKQDASMIPWPLFVVPVLALACHIVLFSRRTRIARMKMNVRLISGMAVYFMLTIVAVLGAFFVPTQTGGIASAAATLSVLVMAFWSLSSLLSHLGDIYKGQKQRIDQLMARTDKG